MFVLESVSKLKYTEQIRKRYSRIPLGFPKIFFSFLDSSAFCLVIIFFVEIKNIYSETH